MTLCKDCEFFKIDYEPVRGIDFGRASCKKHNLVTAFLDRRKFRTLGCIEDVQQEEKKCDTCKHEKERWFSRCADCSDYELWESKDET